MVKGGGGMEPHPNTSLKFYTDLFQYNQEHFNMEMLFTDFLCYRSVATLSTRPDNSTSTR